MYEWGCADVFWTRCASLAGSSLLSLNKAEVEGFFPPLWLGSKDSFWFQVVQSEPSCRGTPLPPSSRRMPPPVSAADFSSLAQQHIQTAWFFRNIQFIYFFFVLLTHRLSKWCITSIIFLIFNWSAKQGQRMCWGECESSADASFGPFTWRHIWLVFLFFFHHLPVLSLFVF